MSAPLWTKETQQKINYTKLCRLLYDGGSNALRSVFNTRCPPSTLITVLTKEQPKLLKLKKPKGKVLNNDQWNKLYPTIPGTVTDPADFDITLLSVLLRNICGLTKPATGWDVLPPPTDNSLEANLVRIKCYRNEVIAHRSSSEVNDVDFEKYWKGISAALVALGLMQHDIDVLKSTRLGIDDYNLLLEEWYQSDEDIQSQLREISKDTSETRSDTSETRSDVKRIKLDVDDTKASTKNIEEHVVEIKQRILDRSHSEIDKLAKRDFSSTITKLCQSYHPKTREWILDEVQSEVEKHRHNTMVLQAGPGMGKSVVAAKLCQLYKEQGNLGACHFFQHDNSLHNNPRLMLQSIARQLCDYLPDYQTAVEKQLKTDFGKTISSLNCIELFTLLFQEPCSELKSEHNIVIVIDALDECRNSLKKEFFEVLNKLSQLPFSLQFILTTRPPPSFSSISIGRTHIIKPGDKRNKADLLMYFSDKLKEHGYLFSNTHKRQIYHLIYVTEGLFLVASFVIDFLRTTNCNSLSEAIEHFPKGKGITLVYENYFSRLKGAMIPHIKSEEGFFKMLDAVVAAKYPILKSIFYDIIGLVDEPRVPNRERKEAIHLLHQLFPVENDHVSAFHKTVIDWLTSGDHDYRVKGDGSAVLASACYDILNSIQEGSIKLEEPPNQTEREQYAFRFGGLYIDSPSFSQDKRIAIQTNCLLFCFQIMNYCQDFIKGKSIVFDFYGLHPLVVHVHKRVVSEIMSYSICIKRYHKQSCPLHHPITLSNFLETVLQSLHLNRITSKIQLTPKPIHLLKEYGFPYQERKVVMKLPDKESSVVKTLILSCDKGVFLLKYNKSVKETLVEKYQLDGTLLLKETFDGRKKMYMSPNNQFTVALPVLAVGDITILDSTTLQVLTRYKAPNVIRTCHVYGSQPWYIVIRCLNNKIYVMDGETGRELHQPVDIDQYDEVEAVSCQGHIVIQRTCLIFPKLDYMCKIFANEEGTTIFEEMIWENDDQTPAQCRKLFLCHFNESHEFIKTPIYPRHQLPQCDCQEFTSSKEYFKNEAIKFSDDGRLLAFVYKNFITVLNTNDYSELSSVGHYMYTRVHYMRSQKSDIQEILFLTKDFIVLNDSNSIYCISLETKDVEHVFPICLNDNIPPLKVYNVPAFVGGEKVFLSISKDLDKRKLYSHEEVERHGGFRRESQKDGKDDRITYIYKHSIYDLNLEK